MAETPEAAEAEKPKRGRPPGSKTKKKGSEKELPETLDELQKLTGGLKPFARPIVRAYSDLMEFISDEALDDEERAMGADTVAALMWYYGLTHPLVLGLLFVGGTTGRRAKKIAEKMKRRRQGAQPPQLAPVIPMPPPPPTPKPDEKPTA